MKQRVLVLCGTDRHYWICPQLAKNLLLMKDDPRFKVVIEFCLDKKAIDYARQTLTVV